MKENALFWQYRIAQTDEGLYVLTEAYYARYDGPVIFTEQAKLGSLQSGDLDILRTHIILAQNAFTKPVLKKG